MAAARAIQERPLPFHLGLVTQKSFLKGRLSRACALIVRLVPTSNRKPKWWWWRQTHSASEQRIRMQPPQRTGSLCGHIPSACNSMLGVQGRTPDCPSETSPDPPPQPSSALSCLFSRSGQFRPHRCQNTRHVGAQPLTPPALHWPWVPLRADRLSTGSGSATAYWVLTERKNQRQSSRLLFIEHLLRGRRCDRHFSCIVPLLFLK